MGRIVLLVALAACTGRRDETDVEDTETDACDPTVPSVDVPDFHAPPAPSDHTIVPSSLDAETDRYPNAHHRIWLPDASVTRREELLLFLPGTANHPSAFDAIGEMAARAGFAVIVLAYDSEINQATYCADVPLDDMADCRTAVIVEKVYGTDESPFIDVDEADSIVGRLLRVLKAADAQYPELGAAEYYDGDAVRWEDMVVAGFSQGSIMAGYLSKDHAAARAVLLAGGCDGLQDDSGAVHLSPWCTETRATPVERTWSLHHALDEPDLDRAIHEAYGLPALGDYADADAESPAYCSGTHMLEMDLPSAGGGTRYHLSVAHDEYMPLDEAGLPVLAEDLFYLLTSG